MTNVAIGAYALGHGTAAVCAKSVPTFHTTESLGKPTLRVHVPDDDASSTARSKYEGCIDRDLSSTIEQGGFGHVIVCTTSGALAHEGHTHFVCKRIDPQRHAQGAAEAERRVHHELQTDRERHPNLVYAFCCEDEGGVLSICMPYYRDGDLLRLLNTRQVPIDVNTSLSLLTQVVSGVDHLHRVHWIAHMDVKPENIFCEFRSSELLLVLGDYGLSKCGRSATSVVGMVGSENFMAPELLFGRSQCNGFKADIWSLGVLGLVLLGKGYPLDSKEDRRYLKHQLEAYEKHGRHATSAPDCLNKYEQTAYLACVKSCMHFDPNARPWAAELEAKLREYYFCNAYRGIEFELGNLMHIAAQFASPLACHIARSTTH